jgi:hypothetical protein
VIVPARRSAETRGTVEPELRSDGRTLASQKGVPDWRVRVKCACSGRDSCEWCSSLKSHLSLRRRPLAPALDPLQPPARGFRGDLAG